MATDITVPTLGESITEATVAKWFKAVGDAVTADEPIAELETDKVTVEVNAPATGTLADITAPEGETVEVGSLLGRVGEGAAQPEPAAEPEPAPAPGAAEGTAVLSPAARKLAEENNLDPAAIPASGRDGRVTKDDVQKALTAGGGRAAPTAAPEPAPEPAPAPAPAPGPAAARTADSRGEERVRMTRLRQRIAERLKEAQDSTAMLTTFNEVDMTNILATRAAYKDAFEKRHGVRLGFMGFFMKAAIQALQEFPALNGEIDGTDLVYKNYYDIGVAVGTDQGLVVPVVRDADKLSIAGIEKTIGELGRKARDGKLSMEELTGGTFTISNGGVYGSLLSTPILNPPQSAILGMHKTQQRPMVMPDGSIQARPMMYLALSYDHRIIDGREAVSSLVRIKECLEDPGRLILDV